MRIVHHTERVFKTAGLTVCTLCYRASDPKWKVTFWLRKFTNSGEKKNESCRRKTKPGPGYRSLNTRRRALRVYRNVSQRRHLCRRRLPPQHQTRGRPAGHRQSGCGARAPTPAPEAPTRGFLLAAPPHFPQRFSCQRISEDGFLVSSHTVADRGDKCPTREHAQPDPMRYTSTASPQRAREETRAQPGGTADDRNSTPYLSDRANAQRKMKRIGQQSTGGGRERGRVGRGDEVPRPSLSPDWTKAGRLRLRRPSFRKALHRTSPFAVR